MKKISFKLLTLVLLSLLFVSTSTVGAKETSLKKEKQLIIQVNGMVCAFCAQGIKKKFKARSEVKDTEVDLDKMTVILTLNAGKKISQKIIKELITEAGFKFIGVKEYKQK